MDSFSEIGIGKFTKRRSKKEEEKNRTKRKHNNRTNAITIVK